MNKCFLALGGNLCHPRRNIRGAQNHLRKLSTVCLLKSSSLYLTIPVGIRGQPNYWNCVIAITTRLSPTSLLKQCQTLEKKYSRLRKQRWGARTLDIDVLVYGNLNIRTKKLILPHPEMHNRDFVLKPLFEIAPDFANLFKVSDIKSTIIRRDPQYRS